MSKCKISPELLDKLKEASCSLSPDGRWRLAQALVALVLSDSGGGVGREKGEGKA